MTFLASTQPRKVLAHYGLYRLYSLFSTVSLKPVLEEQIEEDGPFRTLAYFPKVSYFKGTFPCFFLILFNH